MFPVRLLIAGSRGVSPSPQQIDEQLRKLLPVEVTELVSGGARGADEAGEVWAHENAIPITRFPADWDRYGKGAGHRRNREMAQYADVALVFWKDNSPGTANMVTWMTAYDKIVRVVRCK